MKKVPRVEKYIRKDGTPVHREYHRFDDIVPATKEEFEQSHLNTLLELTPERDLKRLEKHYRGDNEKTPLKVVKTFPDLGSLLIFDKDVNRKIIKDLLTKCTDELSEIHFKPKDYAALYYIIFINHKKIFTPSTKFTHVQRVFDEYFDIDTHNYKQCSLKAKVKDLKDKYLWIDKL